MSAVQRVHTYQRLRQEPMWRLLAADNGPVVLGLLQALLFDGAERQLASSVFSQRLHRELEALRMLGIDMPQSAQVYIANWVAEGLLKRDYPEGAAEEMYELTVAAIDAIRVVAGIERPHAAATESRLAVVVNAVENLAKETDASKFKRESRLRKDIERLEKELDDLNTGPVRVLPIETAKERAREVIRLAEDLVEDFTRVDENFRLMHRDLRESIVMNDGSRGDKLDIVFTDIGRMDKSEAGRSFKSFWKLLNDKTLGSSLEQALEDIMSRNFVKELDSKEQKFLKRLLGEMHKNAKRVHHTQQTFSRSLRRFVENREYLEQRRLHEVLKQAQAAALLKSQTVRINNLIEFDLDLTSAELSSMSQFMLFDTVTTPPNGNMELGTASRLSVEVLRNQIEASEIDFRSLRANVVAVLKNAKQASVGEVLAQFPAKQGLGSVVGLVTLGSRFGQIQEDQEELITWENQHNTVRALIPTIYFNKASLHELTRNR